MYLTHFGLHERPFSNTPDPGFVYLGTRHEEALAHLLYGVQEHGGFVQLTGEIGTGKTTVCRLLLERLPEGVDVALIVNPVLSPEELLAAVCDELGLKDESGTPNRKGLVDLLYRHLLTAHAAKRRIVLIVDEAQNLTVEALEQLRLLTNLETAKQKLLQIMLIGQPELVELLERPELRQLAQRITARYHLQPFTESETAAYVDHRMRLAGGTADTFERGALREVHRLTDGVPRLINVICDRALLGAYAERSATVNRATVRAAATEVLGHRRRPPRRLLATSALIALAVVAGAAAGFAVTSSRAAAMIRSMTARTPAPQRPAPVATEQAVTAPGAASPAVAPATPSAAPVPATTLSQALVEDVPPSDRASALAHVFALWRLDPRAWNVEPCRAAAPLGLMCVEAVGGWPRIRRLDLPAAIRLVPSDRRAHWAAVVGLAGDTVKLMVGSRAVTAGVGEIEPLWDGRFDILWEPPLGGADGLAPGSRGRPVMWLRQRLDALDGRAGASSGDLYDEALRERVVAFQRNQSLTTDGIAGVETLARLASLVDRRIPSLSRAAR